MTTTDRVAAAALPLFAGVPEADLAALLATARTTALAPGQTLLREGDPGEEVLLILDGAAAVTVGGMPVGTIQAGDCVGEMSLLDNAPRSATVTSSTPLRALVLPADRFRTLLGAHPVVAQRLTATLTARLRSAQTGWAGLAGDPDVLLASLLDLQDSPDPQVAERARRQAATLVERVAERARHLPAASAPRTDAGTDALAPLSPAERKVAALVADGLSNQAIAERLIVSRHTVDTHVKRCYAKLGLRSRVELAAVVLRSGTN